jgi:hypothetical protein
MKKSGLEWLKPQIELMLMDGYKPYPNELEEVFEIAKEMEKEQQGYSEEDVENILIEYVKTNPTKPYKVITWFNKFKKIN